MRYKAIQSFSIIVDEPLDKISSRSVDIYQDHIFFIVSKQKDMFDSNIEYWVDRFGWVFKIEPHHLQLLEAQT